MVSLPLTHKGCSYSLSLKNQLLIIRVIGGRVEVLYPLASGYFKNLKEYRRKFEVRRLQSYGPI